MARWALVLLLLGRASSDIALMPRWREQHCTQHRIAHTKKPDPSSTVVAVATDASNLLPVLAVINSTVSNAKNPVPIVVITRHVQRMLQMVQRFLRDDVDVTVCGGFSDLLVQRPALGNLASLANSSHVKRKELLSPFNFAAFYLPYVLRESRRVLYLDTDIIVEGDVAELDAIDMHGHPAAAVEDCTQKIFKYINMDLLAQYEYEGSPVATKVVGRSGRGAGARTFATTMGTASAGAQGGGGGKAWSRWGLLDSVSNTTCVFNRGVVLFDCARWRELRLTETIEDLVDAFVKSRAKLWRGGISQPPFLLTLAGRYMKLGMEWNVRGLGRIDLGRNEWMLLTEHTRLLFGSEAATFERHMAPAGPFRHTYNPYLCPFAAHAKILHFNGELKPWNFNGQEAVEWRTVGLNLSSAGVQGTCQIQSCPTSVNISTGRRLRSACESWINAPWYTGSKSRWDQQHFQPDGTRWAAKNKTKVYDYYELGCHARPPLCSCKNQLTDDCVTSCAARWHRYVSPEAYQVVQIDQEYLR